jgi:purine-binding chemotaxis protein CheW
MELPEDVITNSSRIIILKMESGAAIGVIVDEVKEVVTLDDSCIEKVGYDAKEEKQNFIKGVGKINGGLVSLLDLYTIIGEKEAY